jgi:hypothetical protein
MKSQLKKMQEPRKNLDRPGPQVKANGPAMRLVEASFMLGFHPAPVEPNRLDRFAHAIPPWLLDQLDALPPDAARHRLEILYRLIYPDGQEMPEPAKDRSSSPVEPAVPAEARPTAGKNNGEPPF